MECYPGLLNQVFLNLVVNAAQAIRETGTITVNTRLDGSWVEIAIADTGSGIPPEVRPRIFSAGFTTKPIGEGTGLGLALRGKSWKILMAAGSGLTRRLGKAPHLP